MVFSYILNKLPVNIFPTNKGLLPMPDDIFDIDITSLSDQFSTIENDINKVKSGFSDLSSNAQAKIIEMVKAAKRYGKSINSIDDAYKNLGSSGETSIKKLIHHLLRTTQSVEETKAIMEKMGVSGRFVSESVDKANKSMSGFSSAISKARGQMYGMVGILGRGTVATIAYGGALREITTVTAKYQKEIYNAVRASQIFGQVHKSAIAGLRGMAAATGLNEQAAAKFYQTYLSVSNGMAPSTGKMVAFVKSIGDEFGNTEEDINRITQQFGKLQSLQIGINLDYLDDLKNGLVDSYDVATKIAKMRILGVDRSTIESFLRLKDSANVKEETKSLKNMSDLVAHLDSVINRFVAQNGDKLKELINSFAKIGQIVVTIFSKIPAPLLGIVVTLKLMRTLASGFAMSFGKLFSNIAGFDKGTESLAKSALKIKAPDAAASAVGAIADSSGVVAAIDNVKRKSGLKLKSVVGRVGGGEAVSADIAVAAKAEKSIGAIGKMFLKLNGVIEKLISSFSAILVGAAAVAAAFFVASKAIKLIFGKKVSAANEALEVSKKAQLAGNESEAKKEAEKIAKISKKSSMISGGVVGGAVVGAAAGLGVAALAALAGITTVSLPLAAALGAVAGVAGGVISASKESAKITKANNVAIMNEQALKGRLNSLTKQEIAAIQKKNEATFDEIKAAKYGSGTLGDVLEVFDKQMPNAAGAFKAVGDWASNLASNVGPAVSNALASLGDGFSYLDSVLPSWLGFGRRAGDNPYKFEMKVNNEVNSEDAKIRKLKLKIKTINSTIESLSLDPKAIGALKKDKEKTEKEIRNAMVRRNMMHSMITNPKYSRQKKEYQEKSAHLSEEDILNSNSKSMKKLREDAQAAADSDVKKFMTDANINRVMDAVLKKYENQKKIIDEMLSSTQELYNLFLKSSNPKLAGESIDEIIKFQDTLVKVSAEASQKMDNLVKSLSGDVDITSRREKISKEINDIDSQLKSLEKKEDISSKYQKKYLNGLKEQLKILKDKNDIEEQNNDIKVLSAKTDKENSKNILQRIEKQELIGTQLDRQKSLLKSDLDLGRQRLDLTKSFMGGIGLTYEMQMEQLGKVRKMQDIVAKQVAMNQVALKKQTKERKEAEEKYQKLLGSGMDEKTAAIRSGLVEARGKEEQTLLNLNKYKMEGLQLAQEEVNLTKELRYGYLSAMQSQAMAAGTFSKILFTREQHLTKMLDRRTSRMKALSQSTPGYNSYVGPLGGRYNKKQVVYARKQYAGGFARHTTTGFKGGEELRNIAFPWYSKNAQKTAEEIVGRTGSTGAAAVSGGVAYGSGAIMDVRQQGVMLANSMGDQIKTTDKVVKATNDLAEAISSTANILNSNEQLIAEETAHRKKIEGQMQKDRPRVSVNRGVNYNANTEINRLRGPVSNKKAVGGIIPSFSSGGVLPLEEGIISGHTGVTGRDSTLRRASGGFFITRRSEARKPYKAKVLDSINAGRYSSGWSNLSSSGEVINVMPEETVTSSKRFEKNPMVLSLLGAINDPKVSDDKFRGFKEGGRVVVGEVYNKTTGVPVGFASSGINDIFSRSSYPFEKGKRVNGDIPIGDLKSSSEKEFDKNEKKIRQLKMIYHLRRVIIQAQKGYRNANTDRERESYRLLAVRAKKMYSSDNLLGQNLTNEVIYRCMPKVNRRKNVNTSGSEVKKKPYNFFDEFTKKHVNRNSIFIKKYGINNFMDVQRARYKYEFSEMMKYYKKNGDKINAERASRKGPMATYLLEKWLGGEERKNKKNRGDKFYEDELKAVAYLRKIYGSGSNFKKNSDILFGSDEGRAARLRARLEKMKNIKEMRYGVKFRKKALMAIAYEKKIGKSDNEIKRDYDILFGPIWKEASNLYERIRWIHNSEIRSKRERAEEHKLVNDLSNKGRNVSLHNNSLNEKRIRDFKNRVNKRLKRHRFNKEEVSEFRDMHTEGVRNNKIINPKVASSIPRFDYDTDVRNRVSGYLGGIKPESYMSKAEIEKLYVIKREIEEKIEEGLADQFNAGFSSLEEFYNFVNDDENFRMKDGGIIGSSGLISSYASEGFPGQPKGIDTERYMLSAGDVVLNREATNIYRDIHGRVPGKMVSPSGGKINSVVNGNQPFFVASGEAIIPAKEARSIGYGYLTAMNELGNSKKVKAGRMAFGGVVGNINNKIGNERKENIAKNVAQIIASQNIVGGFVPSKNSQSGVGGSVSVGGITIGYHHNDNKSKEENDEALVQSVVEKVEQELREALIKEQKQRVI